MESLKTEQITQVAAGGAFGCAHSLALSQAGRTFSWGANEHGQLGYCPHIYCTKTFVRSWRFNQSKYSDCGGSFG